MANGNSNTFLNAALYADNLSGTHILEDREIREANKVFKEMFGYSIETGSFTDVLSGRKVSSPVDYLKRMKDMYRNIVDVRTEDIERSSWEEPLFNWKDVDAGVSLMRKRRLFNESIVAEPDKTKVELQKIPEETLYIDPESDEGKRAIKENQWNKVMESLKDDLGFSRVPIPFKEAGEILPEENPYKTQTKYFEELPNMPHMIPKYKPDILPFYPDQGRGFRQGVSESGVNMPMRSQAIKDWIKP